VIVVVYMFAVIPPYCLRMQLSSCYALIGYTDWIGLGILLHHLIFNCAPAV